jgi:hypothetical protein
LHRGGRNHLRSSAASPYKSPHPASRSAAITAAPRSWPSSPLGNQHSNSFRGHTAGSSERQIQPK